MSVSRIGEVDKEDLRATLARVIDIDVAEVLDNTDFRDDLEVDSLMALEIVVVLEKKYDVRLSEGELKQITCLQNAYDLLIQKLAFV